MWIFLIVSTFIIICITILMPKNISKIELYISYFFMLILSWSINVVIDAKYNLRSFFQNGPDYPTMMIFLSIFPCFGVIFLNFYPYKRRSIIKKTAYIIFCVLMLFGFDVLLVKFNILHYNNWRYAYTIILYIIEFLCVLLNTKIVSCLNTDAAYEEDRR